MSQLEKAQQAVLTYLNHGGESPLYISKSAFHSQVLDIYKGSILGNHLAAFEEIYPVIKRLVGLEFFEYAFVQYKKKHPNNKYDISRYGDNFPKFLADFEACKDFAYLSDVAQLELMCHQACLSKKDPLQDFSLLGTLDEATLARVSFLLPSSASLLKSEYPLLEIYNANQPECLEPKEVNLDQGGDRLFIFQNNLDLKIASLSKPEFDCLMHFKNQQPLEKMLYDLSNRYNLSEQVCQDILSKMIQRGWLVGFNVLE